MAANEGQDMASGVDGDSRRLLKQLFEAHAGQVHAFASRRLDSETAEDVVSETFLVAWRRIEQVPEPALPWLLGTARKVIANELRRRSRHQGLIERVATAKPPDKPQPDPSSTGTGEAISAALGTLTDTDQEVLVLSAWYGLSGIQAARVLGCSPATYAVRLHRARRRFRAALRTPEGTIVSSPQADQEALS